MNFEKYQNDGWGISVEGFQQLFLILNGIKKTKEEIFIIELGSGISTSFFHDYALEENCKINLTSIDNDIKYKHKDAILCPLIFCSDSSFEEMFDNKKFDRNKFVIKKDKPRTRQRNCFYDIDEKILKSAYDLMLLDGPHGNGRSIAFLITRNLMSKGSYIFIDDYTHYDFEEKANSIFQTSIIRRHNAANDVFLILKVEGTK